MYAYICNMNVGMCACTYVCMYDLRLVYVCIIVYECVRAYESVCIYMQILCMHVYTCSCVTVYV